MFPPSSITRSQWIARFVFRSVRNRKFRSQPPRTDLRWSGKQITIHTGRASAQPSHIKKVKDSISNSRRSRWTGG